MNAPVRTRGTARAMLFAGAATGGVTALLMLSPLGGRAAMPGPLSDSHARLRNDCAACHAESPDAVHGPGHGLSLTSLDREQSSRCLACHDDLGQRPLHPHAWSETQLAGHRAEAGGAALRGVPAGPGGTIACATCHVEHDGGEHDLTALDDARCQTCHANRFGGFTDGHPAFEAFPYRRRTRIVFDHDRHLGDYFAREPDLAPEACDGCHRPDSAGRWMLLAGYEASCAACHDAEIRGASQVDGSGLVFLALPALDTVALEEAELGIGDWPADSSLVETPLGPFVRLLLRADEHGRRDLEALAGRDLLDLSDAAPDELEAVADLAWRIKELVRELRDGGHAALAARLRAALAGGLEAVPAANLVRLLPRALLGEAASSWFPRLDLELAERAAGRAPPTSVAFAEVEADSDRARESWVELGGWHLQELDFSLRYRPVGHGDRFLLSWLDVAASEPGGGLLGVLSGPGAVGACTRCHSLEAAREREVVNWNGGPRSEDADPLTRFFHRPHLVSASQEVCADCHEPTERPGAYLETYEQADPGLFAPGFRPVEREVCSRCHQPRGAPAACTTCHRYHAGAAR